jgi:hypothetical protein
MVVDLTSAAKHDHYLLKEIHLPKDSTMAIYLLLLLSAKPSDIPKRLLKMPINRCFVFVFEKVSPPTQN